MEAFFADTFALQSAIADKLAIESYKELSEVQDEQPTSDEATAESAETLTEPSEAIEATEGDATSLPVDGEAGEAPPI